MMHESCHKRQEQVTEEEVYSRRAHCTKGLGHKMSFQRPREWTSVPEYNDIIDRLFSVWDNSPSAQEDWKSVRGGESHVVDIQPDLHGPVKMARGQGFIRATPQEVFQVLLHVERRPDWDDLCDYGSQVRQLGDNADIVYLSYQGKLGVCARDLCLLRGWLQNPDGSAILVAHSIECGDVPKVAGKVRAGQENEDGMGDEEQGVGEGTWVRAECHDCAYMITPMEDGCLFSYAIQLDMKGYVPLFFSNLIQTQHPLIISMLRKNLEIPSIVLVSHVPDSHDSCLAIRVGKRSAYK
ncbi:hypothetical protein GUITHDRAFT_111123 [Guillardia theta CCMP2712]|uniref:START domain-containing protein n=1 Tax=Guillardia theta (strain CCMP2712) TaxID=905079 RepID=L1J373_GUITC|nr:hypothetical protein GUITHDRAFT_111123 [Guillardia theta CCMP2712]EKX42752.1 hypothetical protein GUITHDRAFT_111123 [Guillardia theta CCMP2712]|eukprot:XP_005829732.1 hypothetical protein GUITHDRAFT_111123 [Guillardia theta CCMP2712]